MPIEIVRKDYLGLTQGRHGGHREKGMVRRGVWSEILLGLVNHGATGGDGYHQRGLRGKDNEFGPLGTEEAIGPPGETVQGEVGSRQELRGILLLTVSILVHRAEW